MIIPNKNYGINEQTQIKSEIDKKIEDISINGFTVLEDCFNKNEILKISKCFNDTKEQFHKMYSYSYLKSIDEHNGIRAPFLIDKTGKPAQCFVLLILSSSKATNIFPSNNKQAEESAW